jgi:hypothetical protein
MANKINRASIQSLDWFDIGGIFNIGLDISIDSKSSDQVIKIIAGDVLYKKQLLTPFFDTVRHFIQSLKFSIIIIITIFHIINIYTNNYI